MRCRRSPRCSSRAATRCCSTSKRGDDIACSAERATTPPARRSTRSPSFSACRIPGGPHVERLAADERQRYDSASRDRCCAAIRAPADADYYDLSFSGLKTAVLNAVKTLRTSTCDRGAIARAFQDALIDTLVEKTARAVRAFGRTRVVLGGGVACNKTLVAAMRERFAPRGVEVFAPSRAARDRQRRDDRARRPVSSRARRTVAARSQRLRHSAHSRTRRRMTLASSRSSITRFNSASAASRSPASASRS